MSVRYVIVLALCLAIVSPGLTQNGKYRDLQLHLDWAAFQAPDSKVYIEFYYELNRAALQYKKSDDDMFKGDVICHLRIFKPRNLLRKEEETVSQKVWRLDSVVEDTSFFFDKNEFMVDLLRYELDPEKYLVKLAVKDMNNEQNIDSVQVEIDPDSFPRDETSLSDIQLSTSISKSDKKESPFYKHTYKIIPNPSLVFGQDRGNMFFYLEAYELGQDVASNTYKATYYIAGPKGNVIDSLGVLTKERAVVPNSIEVGMMNVSPLATGKYSFHFDIADGGGNQVASSEKSFYIYNPTAVKHAFQDPDFQAEIRQSPFADMNEEALDDELAYIKYLASRQEREIIETLGNERGKREFLWAFWRRQSGMKGFTMSVLRDSYLARIEHANDEYRSVGRAGWKTERGRVYVQYGEPTDVDIFHSDDQTYGYEIWLYDHVQNGAEFVFADRRGTGEWDLLHSNVFGEIQNPDWRRFLRK